MHHLYKTTSVYLCNIYIGVCLSLSGCGQYSPESNLSSRLASAPSADDSKKVPNSRKKALLVAGGVAVGGVAATCLLIVKTKKVCQGLLRQQDKTDPRVAEALAEIKHLKQELEHTQASHGRLYEKHLKLEKETTVYLGRQANVNGLTLEYVSTKEVPLILRKMGVKVEETIQNVIGRYRNSDKGIVNFEIDAIFLTKDRAYFLEAKTQLSRSQVDKFSNHIANFNQATFDHPQISEKLADKEMRGVMTYVFDSNMPRDMAHQGKSASDYARKTHGIDTFRIFSWKELRTLRAIEKKHLRQQSK